MTNLSQKQNQQQYRQPSLRRLKLMADIRRLICEGYNYDYVMTQLSLNKRTFYRLLNKVFEQDRKALELYNYEELLRQLCILRERYNQHYMLLRSMAEDPKNNVADRLNTIASMQQLADTLMRLHRDSPALIVVQQKKLEGLQKGSIHFEDMITRERLRPAGVWLPMSQQQAEQEQVEPEEPEEPEEEEQEPANGDARENEEEERRDHW